MQERGALTITGGKVWIPFGGLAGDCGGYKGRVVGVNLDGTGDPIAYTVPTTREAGSGRRPARPSTATETCTSRSATASRASAIPTTTAIPC